MKKYIRITIKNFIRRLLHDYLIEFVEEEMTFQITFVENGQIVKINNMYTVPQVGTSVQIDINLTGNNVQSRTFLVEKVIYSEYGSANRVIGQFED